MKATTRGIAVLLTCVGYASTVAAQTPQAPYTRVFELRQESNQAQAQADAQRNAQRRAKAEALQRRGGARLGGGRIGGQAEASETFSRTVRLERGGTFDLQNGAGDVTITGSGGREATIEVVKQVRALTDARARLVLSGTRVDIAERGGNVEVRTVRAGGGGEVRVNYVITLPESANVFLRSGSGNLRVQRMSGDELNLDTLQGNVIVSDLQSRMLELHTVLGDMMLSNITARRAFVESIQGNLEYAGALQRTGQYRFRTHSGNIRVKIPSGGSGFDLDAMTYKGDLQSDFALKVPQQRPALRRPAPLRMLRGPVGDAGAMLTASTYSGNIVIVRPEGSQ
jgi:DUF4097 and DUF4098 domain-containing protein YvlB